MKIITWNVNSVRARIEGIHRWIQNNIPDIMLLQETKVEDIAFPQDLWEEWGYDVATWGQKTYNGVAIAVKKDSKFSLQDVSYGWLTPGQDDARYIQAWTGYQWVASVYVPNGQSSDKSWQDKGIFMDHLQQHLQGYRTTEEPVIIGGDFNITYDKNDVSPDWTSGALGSDIERHALRTLARVGFIDPFLYTTDRPFTWWDYRHQAWSKNVGLRIDTLWYSPDQADLLKKWGVDTTPRAWERPSDHAPVWGELSV